MGLILKQYFSSMLKPLKLPPGIKFSCNKETIAETSEQSQLNKPTYVCIYEKIELSLNRVVRYLYF